MNIIQNEGGLAIAGSDIDYIVKRWMAGCDQTCAFQKDQGTEFKKKTDNFSIILMTLSEYESLDHSWIEKIEEIIQSCEIMDVGVGMNDVHVYVICFIPKLQRLRQQAGLAPFDFCISLTACVVVDESLKYSKRSDILTLCFAEAINMHQLQMMEQVLSVPCKPIVRFYLHYEYIANIALQSGYLFGAYYKAKHLFEGGRQSSNSEVTSHAIDILQQAISDPASCKCIETSAASTDHRNNDYGVLVCDVLNHEPGIPATSLQLKRKVYTSRVARQPRDPLHAAVHFLFHDITAQDLPRNFSFVRDFIAGSSVPTAKAHFESFVSLGITDIITVTEAPLQKPLTTDLALHCHFFQVMDRTCPSVQQMLGIMAVIDDVRSGRGKVLVHCHGGVGRTAIVLAAYLMWSEGISRDEAKRPLLTTRKTILSQSQEAFLSDWYQVCLDRASSPTSMAPPSIVPTLGELKTDGTRDNAKPAVKLPSLLLLVGFPASGKSTFASSLCDAFPNHICRLNQDEMGRRACETQIGRLTKLQGLCVILDRCNLQKEERKQWCELAHNKRAWVVFFDVSSDECKWRISRRTGHPTVPHGGGRRIIESVADKLEVPSAAVEGFDRVFVVKTFGESNALLAKWGCDTIPVSNLVCSEFENQEYLPGKQGLK
jgi:hypothetical protein